MKLGKGKKMTDILRLLAEAFLTPFIMMMILIDESRHIDEDGTWSGERGEER